MTLYIVSQRLNNNKILQIWEAYPGSEVEGQLIFDQKDHDFTLFYVDIKLPSMTISF